MLIRYRIALGHTHALHLRIYARVIARCDEALKGGDKEWENTCARGTACVAVSGQGIVALPDATCELSVPTESGRAWHVSISAIRVLMMIRSGNTHPRMISIASALIHHGRSAESCSRENERVPQSVRKNVRRSESLLRDSRRGGVVIGVRVLGAVKMTVM